MLKRLKNIVANGLGQSASGENSKDTDEPKLAAAVLMVEAAAMDNEFDEAERAKIKSLLCAHFDLDAPAAEALIVEAGAKAEETVEIYGLSREIKNAYSEEERIKLLEMLWEIAYTDGELHDREASFMRRLTGLLYVSDRDSGSARRRARERAGLAGT